MGHKRITRAKAQAGMELIENELRDSDSFAGDVQDFVRNVLGSMSIPPQQEKDILENAELTTEHYENVSEILVSRAREEAEKCVPDEDTIESAERLAFIRRRELERLNLDKTDPELHERQWQVLANIKARLVEYPALLGQVTGDATFMQAVKNSYKAKLEGYETTINELIPYVFKLPEICSNKVSNLLERFAETSVKPAIDIVKLQHERLETELGEAAERSEQLEKRIEELKAELENAGAEKIRLDMEHQAREENFTQETTALKKKLEEEREVIQDQKEKHKRETTDLKSQLEKTRTTAAEQVKCLREEIGSYSRRATNLEKDKEALGESVDSWIERVNARRQEYDDLQAKHRAKEEQLRSAQVQVFSLEEGLRAEKEAVIVVKQTAEQEKESLRNELTAMKETRDSAESQIQSLKSQLLKATNENVSLKESSEKEIRSLQSQLSTKKSLQQLHEGENQAFQSQFSTARNEIDLFGIAEQYTGSTAEMVSMPKYMPGMTLVGKATELPEPNLAAARRLWISSRCGSLDLDIAQAFFMQQEISSDQFALLPWIHATLSCAAITMCEKSTLTPDLARSFLWVLQGLVYTATVAHEWPEDHVWSPKIEEILTQITYWLREHVPNEASLLKMIVGQVNEILSTHESPSTSISPSLVPESRRIDSANSDIPEGMAMVIDISGIIILFTADDNAFVFGASEVKVMEVDYSASMLIKFDQAVIGLPATLMEIRLLNRHSPIEIYERHYPLLKSVLTEDRIAVVYPFMRQRR